jgi:hypothetical protein
MLDVDNQFQGGHGHRVVSTRSGCTQKRKSRLDPAPGGRKSWAGRGANENVIVQVPDRCFVGIGLRST